MKKTKVMMTVVMLVCVVLVCVATPKGCASKALLNYTAPALVETEGKFVAITHGDTYTIFNGQKKVVSGSGQVRRWDGDKALIVQKDPLYPSDEIAHYVSAEGITSVHNTWGIPKNGIRIVSSSASPHNPGRVFDGYDNTMWGQDGSSTATSLIAETPKKKTRIIRMVSYPQNSINSIRIWVNGNPVRMKYERIYPGDITGPVEKYRVISTAEIQTVVTKISLEIRGEGGETLINEIRLLE